MTLFQGQGVEGEEEEGEALVEVEEGDLAAEEEAEEAAEEAEEEAGVDSGEEPAAKVALEVLYIEIIGDEGAILWYDPDLHCDHTDHCASKVLTNPH